MWGFSHKCEYEFWNSEAQPCCFLLLFSIWRYSIKRFLQHATVLPSQQLPGQSLFVKNMLHLWFLQYYCLLQSRELSLHGNPYISSAKSAMWKACLPVCTTKCCQEGKRWFFRNGRPVLRLWGGYLALLSIG